MFRIVSSQKGGCERVSKLMGNDGDEIMGALSVVNAADG